MKSSLYDYCDAYIPVKSKLWPFNHCINTINIFKAWIKMKEGEKIYGNSIIR